MRKIQTTGEGDTTRARFHLAGIFKEFEFYILGELDGDFALAVETKINELMAEHSESKRCGKDGIL